MKSKRIRSMFALMMALGALLPACVSAPASNRPAPDQVTRDFYAWYLSYAEKANPLVDKAYRASDALSSEFVARLDEFTAGEMDFDPILCAQDAPASVTVAAPAISGATATVRVETSFAGHSFEVRLAQQAGAWKITEVVCAAQ